VRRLLARRPSHAAGDQLPRRVLSPDLDRLARWDLHPERVVTDRFALADAATAYATADSDADGKVAITWPG
jgi:threonine dehydrogenase-like Zn-dependent dehydrogenase